jgi:UDP-N-acetylglucosamine 2-epimerase
MSATFFRQLKLPPPDVNLNVGSGTHAEQIARMLPPLERLVLEQRPDWVLVYGDTNSTLAGALVAPKLQIPLAHVEAGLRSYNRTMPEEINRVLVDHASNLLLCPTPTAVQNLAQEGITKGVVMTGDIMVDALVSQLENARQVSTIHAQLSVRQDEPYAVTTIHRPANADQPHASRSSRVRTATHIPSSRSTREHKNQWRRTESR